MHYTTLSLLFLLMLYSSSANSQDRPRESGVIIGVLPTGTHNAITDVPGVKVGHTTRIRGKSVRTGVTAILPYDGNIFQQKVPAAIYLGNGFGKLAGYSQVEELGNLETPIVLTNTLSVPTAVEALIDYTLDLPGNENVRSVNGVVGETNDGYLNDIRGRHVRKKDVLGAIANAESGPVTEGNVGAGTGTICFGFKGGIGTSSRKLPESLGGYTVGVLVQTNFGGVLTINGKPVGQELGQYYFKRQIEGSADGSCMMVLATDAPLDARNLKRVAKRAMLGLARTGGIASNGSGDYVIAFSTAESLRIPYSPEKRTLTQEVLHNDVVSPIFLATIEATEEAIINSLFAARTLTGSGHTVEALPVERVLQMMDR
ncbi:DmpA family aminopeptidase [Flavilitoribacter nigricans]|uniref:Aminopeptidase n=1 Tax=Flavilitoribacter nigricans (strain ATCC 23147 / DSM 23189 / NBRC 102662 / NCIMB 1420 / SS-2) TaxID=1122177 RepID=A0A2D0NA41_FLAN2|nr:aminopeptidase [Flavilitoribacter nigricans DSM 23189 = NBRC 102662]